MTGPIDAVVTWVDGHDPAHQRKRSRFIQDLDERRLAPNALSSTRFADAGELWHTVRLIRRHAPWVRHIFLVTDDQRPVWLTTERARAYGLRVVDHRQIFSGYDQFLPTFNSNAIESMLHRIPGLADRFIYFNDDFFILRPVSVDDYFQGESPVLRGVWRWNSQGIFAIQVALAMLRGEWSHYRGLVGRRNERGGLSGRKFFALAHAPHPIVKRRFAESLNEERLIPIIRDRFRSVNQQWPLSLYANDLLATGGASVGPRDWGCVKPGDGAGRLRHLLCPEGRLRHLCVQSLDRMEETVRQEILYALDVVASTDWPDDPEQGSSESGKS